MTQFNISEVHSMGMLALSTALDKLVDPLDIAGMEFRAIILEQFELNFFRCLVHTCPEHIVAVEFNGEENHKLSKQLLFDNVDNA
jgi:hypothetical protein